MMQTKPLPKNGSQKLDRTKPKCVLIFVSEIGLSDRVTAYTPDSANLLPIFPTLPFQVRHHCLTSLADRVAEVLTTVGIDPVIHCLNSQVTCDVAIAAPVDTSDETLYPVQVCEVRALVTGMVVFGLRAYVKLAGL